MFWVLKNTAVTTIALAFVFGLGVMLKLDIPVLLTASLISLGTAVVCVGLMIAIESRIFISSHKRDIGLVIAAVGLVLTFCLGGAEMPSIWYNIIGGGIGLILLIIGVSMSKAWMYQIDDEDSYYNSTK